MTWAIKAGANDPNDPPEYLHAWNIGPHCELKDVEWTQDQKLAHRFDDRNHAARTCNSFPISAYSEDVRLVKLTRRNPVAAKEVVGLHPERPAKGDASWDGDCG